MFRFRKGIPKGPIALSDLLLLFIILLSGCGGLPIQTSSGTHYLIIGIGIVSVPRQDSEAALVVRQHSVGASFNSVPASRFTLGYAGGTVVAIPANAEDVRVEVVNKPGGLLQVHSPAAALKTGTNVAMEKPRIQELPSAR